MTSPIVRTSRRKFLQYIAASPVVASGAIEAYGMEAPSKLPDPMIWAPTDHELIKIQRMRLTSSTSSLSRARTCRQLISATWHRGSTTRSRCEPIVKVS